MSLNKEDINNYISKYFELDSMDTFSLDEKKGELVKKIVDNFSYN